MNMHKGARLTPYSRALLVERMTSQGLRAEEAAKAAGVSVRTAYKWLRRFRDEGFAGLVNRSSCPRTCPHATPVAKVAQALERRRARHTYRTIARDLALSPSTVGRVLQRDRLVAASLHRMTANDTDDIDDAIEIAARCAESTRFHLNHLPRLSTRHEHIKQLRQTILNLAVRGKLVPQDSNEGTATLSQALTETPPLDLPPSWCFSRLANLLAEDTRNGYSRRPDDEADGTPILRISAGTVRRDGIVAEEEHKLISGIDAQARLQYGLRSGDLLACRFNGNKSFVGRLTIFNDYLGLGPIYPDKLIRVRVAPQLALPSFIQIAGGTDMVRGEVEDACATTVGNWGISASSLKQVRFPLPPLAEQHRIVARVGELMALCDQLEASLASAQTDRTRLLDALLHEALASAVDHTDHVGDGRPDNRASGADALAAALH